MNNLKVFLKSKTSVNIFSNWFIHFLKIFITLFSIPLLLDVYNKVEYGSYALYLGFISFASIFDFGNFNNITRLTIKYKKSGDKIKYHLNLGYVLRNILISNLLIFIIGVVIIYFRKLIFNYDLQQDEMFFLVLIFALINTFFFNLLQITLGILQGYQRNYLHNIGIFFATIFITIVYIIIYYKEIDFIKFIFLNTIVNLIALIFNIYFIKELNLFKGYKYNKMKSEEEVVSFQKNYFLLNIFGFFTSNSDKFILAIFTNVSTAGIYDLISRPYYLLKAFMGNFFSIYQAKILSMSLEIQKKIINNTFKIFVQIGILILIFAYFFIDDFYLFWLKDETLGSIPLLSLVLISASVINLISGSVHRIFIMNDNIRGIRNVEIIGGICNALISVLGAKYIAFYYVIFGTIFQVSLMLLYIFLKAINSKHLKFNFNDILIYTVFFILVGTCLIFNSIIILIILTFYTFFFLFSFLNKISRYLK